VWTGILFPGQKDLNITFIDVGQGASVLLETPCGVNILVDAGGEPTYSADPGVTGEKVVLPFLRYQGISEIDLAIVTHPHEDHFGGFLYLVGQIPIGGFLISPVSSDSPHYLNLLNKAAGEGIPVEVASAGLSWRSGSELQLRVLSPPDDLIRGDGSELNNNSLVLLLQYKEVEVLLTGDIENTAVLDLLNRYPDLNVDLLQIPHHGGYLPSIAKLLETAQPDLAVIQVGVNSFGHPHPHLLEALEEAGVPFYRTDFHGAIICRTNGRELEVTVTGSPAVVR
jgi:competence protein ComEC